MGIFVEKVQEYSSPSQWSTQIPGFVLDEPGLVSEPGVVNEEPVLIVEAGVVFG